jgi:hypothetical protein
VPLAASALVSVLFHWIELYMVTITSLRRDEMLEKINSRYASNVTLENILDRVLFISNNQENIYFNIYLIKIS